MEDELDLIKQLLKGAILATYDVVNLDEGGKVEKGLSLDEGFEKQWAFIEPELRHHIVAARIDTANHLHRNQGRDLPKRDFYDFIKILFGVCLTIGLVVFTTALSVMLAYKIAGAL